MKQTAVEWFTQELDKRHCVILNYPEYQRLLEQAKAMEKEQIKDAWDNGYNRGYYDPEFEKENIED